MSEDETPVRIIGWGFLRLPGERARWERAEKAAREQLARAKEAKARSEASTQDPIGQGATYNIGSDRYPATVVEVTRFKTGARAGQLRTVTVQDDVAILISGSEQDGSARYRYERDENPYPGRRTFTVDSHGRFMDAGSRLSIGHRNRYRDPHV